MSPLAPSVARRLAVGAILSLAAASAGADVAFSPTSVSIAENGGSATVTLVRTGGKPREYLRYSTVAGTASSGVDYTASSGVCFELAPNVTTYDITVPITNDGAVESSETFDVTLAAVAVNACGPGTQATFSVIAAGTATVTIVDDDTPDVVAFGAANVSVGETGGTATLTITRTGNGVDAASVTLATANGTATAGQDYTATSTTVNWASGDTTSKTVAIAITNDASVESGVPETFTATISNPSSNLSLGSPTSATVSITDNDVDVPNVVGQTQAAAGTALNAVGLATGTITATQSTTVTIGTVLAQAPVAGTDVDPSLTGSVDLDVSDGTRVPDVTGQTQANASTALTTAGLIVGTVTNAYDAVVPAGSVVNQSPTASATTPVEPGSAVDLVISSGPAPSAVLAFVGDVSVDETNGIATVSVTRTNNSTGSVSVDVSTSNGSASAGTDYTTVTTTLTWGDGDASTKTVDVAIVNDASVEASESFAVALSNPTSGASLGAPASVTVTIADNDVDVPNVVGQTQTAAGTALNTVGLATGTVTATQSTTVAIGTVLSQSPVAGTDVDPSLAAPVDLEVSDGTRVPDVTGQTQANATSAITTAGLVVGTVTNVSDAVVPAGSVVSQSPTASATTPVEPGSAVDLVISSGPAPSAFLAFVSDVSVDETDAVATVSITRTNSSTGSVSVDVSTSNSSASAGTDYTTVTTTITWADGDTSTKTVDVAIVNDASVEASESFAVALSNPSSGASLGAPASVTVTIADNDVDVPNVVGQTQTAAGTALNAAGLATGALTLTQSTTIAIGTVLSQSPVAGTDVDPSLTASVDLEVSDGTRVPDVTGQTQANATDALTTAGLVVGAVTNTYDAVVPAGSVVSQSPTASATTPVEPGSAVDLVISSGPAPSAVLAFVGDVSVDETNGIATVSVTRTNNSTGSVSVDVSTSNGSASAGTDYTTVTTTITWADGDSATKTVDVTLVNDASVEGSESFVVSLTNPSLSASLGAPASVTVTIADNDVAVPGVVGESQAAAATTLSGVGLTTGALTLTQSTTIAIGTVLSQSPVAGTDVDPSLTGTVDLDVSDGSRVPDVTGQTQANATSAITTAGLVVGTVTNVSDAVVPAGSVVSQSPTASATTPVEPGSAVDLVISSGPAPNSILAFTGDVSVAEGAGTALLTVTRTGDSTGSVSVDVGTSDGSASATTDYTAVSTTLTWADGDSADKTVAVPILDDDLFEGAVETFVVALTDPSSGASLGATNTATVSITDDDTVPTLAFETATVGVSESVDTVVVNVTRAGASGGAVTVDFATTPGTASSGSDFVATSGTLSWADGDSAPKSITVSIVGDANAESPAVENFTVNLTNPTGGASVGSPATVTIAVTDDDAAPPVTDLAGPDQTVVSPTGAPAAVTLEAQSDVFASYQWRLDGNLIATGASATVNLPLGTHDIQLTAVDGNGVATVDVVRITVTRAALPENVLTQLPDLDPTEQSVAAALDRLCPRLNTAVGLTAEQEDLRERCTQLILHDDAAEQADALDQLSGRPVTTMMTELLELRVLQERNIASRLRALRGGDRGVSVSGLALNVHGQAIPDAALQSLVDALGGGAGDETSDIGVFLTGSVFVGEKDETGRETGFEFDITGLTAGIDYRVSERLVVGAALGYAAGDGDFDRRLGDLESESWTGTAFGSWYGTSAYLDVIGSRTISTQDETRRIAYNDASGPVQRTARGSGDGDLLSFGTEVGMLLGDERWRLNPRLGAFYAVAQIDRFAERGADGLDLRYHEQNADSLTISIGGSVSYALRTDSALWTPEFRIDAVSELEDGGQTIRANFANDPFAGPGVQSATPDILIFTDELDDQYLSLGVGLAARFDNGYSTLFDWQIVQSRRDVSASEYGVSFRIERSF